MTKAQAIELPLYDFFDALRKNGFFMGIAEYYGLLDALHLGYGIDTSNGAWNRTELLEVCRLLWLKPNQSKYLFESTFNEFFQESTSKKKTEDSVQKEEPKKADMPRENTDSADRKTDDEPMNEIEEQDLPLVKFVIGSSEGDSINLEEKAVKPSRKFIFTDYYFDLSKREMQQSCRFLPNTQDSLSSNEIDIMATVQQFARNGRLTEPVFKTQRRIANEVLLLTDNGGSMIAFERLSDTFRLALENAFKTNIRQNKAKVKTYYFYNLPEKHCYLNKSHTEHKKTANILAASNPKYSDVIIISDASAARGGNSDGRFKATLRFLLQLQKVSKQIVWLNPLPNDRWEMTTAARIARIVPMFSLNEQSNLQKAINVLKGKSR
ncbi:MAG: hypothetical protein AAF806_03820 [Bacteroidota bacterium]